MIHSNSLLVHDRCLFLRSLAAESHLWDIIVIGGGATGLGIALDGVSRGYKVLLVEQADFAKGTSSRSTKLVHGGVRYLAQGNIRLVREACIERGLLCRNAPHLVTDQSFILPTYSYFELFKYWVGLKLYDWIAGRLSLGSSTFVSRTELLEKMPTVEPHRLKGGIRYHDGQFDDARLALNLVQTIWEQGGVALNYVKVQSLVKDAGLIKGVVVQEIESGETFSFAAKAVVNATGVFVDDILQMDSPGIAPTIRVSQGTHIVISRKFLPSSEALMIPKTSDGRVLFAVPWHDKLVLGTTDVSMEKARLEPQPQDGEIDFILDTAGRYLVHKPTRKDVLSVFAGLRPLAAPKAGRKKTKEISRSHKIVSTGSGLFTMLGGKWTTFRKMGEDMLDRIEKDLGWPATKSRTASMPIHGFDQTIRTGNPFSFYGSDAALLQQQLNGSANQWISEELRIHRTQVTWAVTHEMARTLEDVLARRTRALFLNAIESLRIAPEVADIMARALGRDEDWKMQQLAGFQRVARNYIIDY